MRLLRLGQIAWLVVVVGCQGPAPTTPTPTSPVAPTRAPTLAPTTPPTAAPTSPTAVAPTSAPTVAPPAATQPRIDVLNAASTAFSAGQFETASGLYQRVVDTPPAAAEGSSATAVTDLARFRGMLSLLAAGQEDEARVQLDALQQRDPESPLARLAAQLWDQYGMTAQVRAACVQLQPQILSQAASTLSTLQSLGVTVDAQTLCTLPNA